MMAGYKPFYQEDADAYLRLYKKYLDWKFDEMKRNFANLPTDVIERIFDGTNIHREEERLFSTFGFNHVKNVAKELEAYSQLQEDGKLVGFLGKFGHRVNEKKIGVRNKN